MSDRNKKYPIRLRAKMMKDGTVKLTISLQSNVSEKDLRDFCQFVDDQLDQCYKRHMKLTKKD